jgi:hypothetical protein
MRGQYVQNRGIEISMNRGTALKIPIIPVPPKPADPNHL